MGLPRASSLANTFAQQGPHKRLKPMHWLDDGSSIVGKRFVSPSPHMQDYSIGSAATKGGE
jgi:hypothetical protein